MSPCFHQWHLEAPRVPLFCSYHAYCDGICERSHISITNPRLFWPIPSVLATQTKWNSQGHDRSGVAKKRVRFGSGREKKKLITQHDPHLPGFFTLQLLSRCWIWSCVLAIERPEQPMLILPHSHAPSHCLQFVPRKQFLSQAAAKSAAQTTQRVTTLRPEIVPGTLLRQLTKL